MPNRTPQLGAGPLERKRARPIPDPDSLAMDDRGTRTYQAPPRPEPDSQPDDEPPPERPEDGNYIGDPPIKPDEPIRAADLPDDWTPAPADAPTIIREVNRQ